MIEMLGVLALIGVLTVGGIAGYSKAMWMYKSNRQKEQISLLVNAVNRNLNDFRKMIHPWTGGIVPKIQLSELLVATGDIPEEMITDNKRYLRDAFGKNIDIYITTYIGILADLRDDDEYSYETCRNFYLIGQQLHSMVYQVSTLRWDNVADSYQQDAGSRFGDLYHHSRVVSPDKMLKNIKLSDIESVCRVCQETRLCRVYFMWW